MVGRPPKDREGSYGRDAQQVLRLVEATQIDSKVPASWKKKVKDQGTKLAQLLLQHP